MSFDLNKRILNACYPDTSSGAKLIGSCQGNAGSGDADPVGWYPYAIPTISQGNIPSCVGQAWANWLEMMIRRYIGNVIKPGQQIDGHAIWKRAREMFWSGNLNGGLMIPQGFHAMLDLGILPKNSLLFQVSKDWNSVNEQLRHTPLVQAHHVHKGWANPDPISGLIDHEPVPLSSDGYHCTVLMATGIHGANSKFRVGQNSWGPNYAKDGYFAMTEDEWFEGVMEDGPYTVELPENWVNHKGLMLFMAESMKEAA